MQTRTSGVLMCKSGVHYPLAAVVFVSLPCIGYDSPFEASVAIVVKQPSGPGCTLSSEPCWCEPLKDDMSSFAGFARGLALHRSVFQ